MAKKDNSAIAWAVGLSTLVVAGVVIVLYEQSQAPPAGSVTVSNPNGTTTTITPAQIAALAAGLDNTTVAAWQASGVPAAQWAALSPAAQSALTGLGVHANAT